MILTAGSSLKGITIKIGADTSELTTALSGVNKNARSLQSELRQVEKLLKMDPGNTDLLRQKQEILSESIENTKNKLEQLRDAEKQVKEQFERGEIGEEQYRALEREIVATEQKLESLEKQAKEFGSVSVQAAKQAGEKFKEAGDKISGVGKNLTKGVTAPILAIGAASIAAFKEVDAALDVIVTKTGATGEAMDGLKESFNNVYKSMPVDASAVGEAIGELNTQFALTGAELEKATTAMIQFAAINGTDVTSATISAKQAIEAYGMEAADLDKVLDAVTVTAQATGVSVDKLFDAAVKGAPTIKAMGLDFAQAVTILGGLEQKGIDSSKALTYLQKAQVALAKEGRTLGEGLGEVVTAIMNCETEADKLSLASEYFGTKGAVFMLDALERGALDFDNLSDAAANAAGTVGSTFEETLDPIDKATVVLNNLKIVGTELAGSLMTALAPILEAIIAKVQKFSDWFSQLDASTQQTIITIAGIVAAVGPLLVVIGSVMSAVGTIITMVPAIVSGITAVGTALTAAMGPIGWVALVIAGLITFLITLWNTNEDFRNGVIAIWEAIKNFFVTTASAIAATFIGAWEAIKAVWNGVASFFTTVVTGIQTAFSNIKQFFLKVGENIINGIKEGLLGGIGKLKEAAETVINKVKGFFTGKQGFDEHSPSKWGFEVGRYVGLGVALGIEQEATKAEQAAQTLASKVFSATSKAFQRQIKFQNMSLAEQIEGWQLIQAQFIEGSEQYLQVEETIFDLRAQQRKEDEQKTREYYTQIEKLIGDAQKTQEEYTSKLKNRTQEIFSSYGLFDEVAKKERVSGNVLLKNLKDQVSSLDGFYSKLDELEARGVGADLVDEIRKMGPDAAANLDALLSMSDERLAEYADLYREKQQLANRVALEELSGLKSDTAEAIRENLEEIDKIYKENAPLLGETLGEGISEGLKATLSELQSFSAPLGGISVLSAGTEVRLADALSSLGSGASYAVAPQATETTPARRDDAKEFVGMMSDAVASAVAAGLQSIADMMFAAMPDDVVLKIGDKQIARAVWSAFESEANRRNRMFAPSREQIMRIAKAAGGA